MKEKEMLYGVSFNIPLLHRANLKLSLFEMVPMCVYVCEEEWVGEREGKSEKATFISSYENGWRRRLPDIFLPSGPRECGVRCHPGSQARIL